MSLRKKILVAIMGAGLALGCASAVSAAPYQHRAHHVHSFVHHRMAHRHMMRRHVARFERR